MAHIRQRDIQLQHFEIAFTFDLHLHRLVTDLHILAQHLEQVLLQLRKIFGMIDPIAAAMGNDDLQPFLGQLSRAFLLRTKNIQPTHSYLPISRPNKPFLASVKRMGTDSPRKRVTISR